jgi:hypothetical protein
MMVPEVTEFPQALRDLATTPEEFWEWGSRIRPGWDLWRKWKDQELVGLVHRHCELHESRELIPRYITELDVYDDDAMLSGFVGDNIDSNASLGWHVDNYDVYAFNIEGRTVWEYFSLITGEIETVELGEMDKILYMPCGVTHQVKVLTDYRTSLSIVKRGTLSGMKLPFHRSEWLD